MRYAIEQYEFKEVVRAAFRDVAEVEDGLKTILLSSAKTVDEKNKALWSPNPSVTS